MLRRSLVFLLIVSSCCLAEDFTVKVDGGSFELGGVSLKTGHSPNITGKVTNKTDREWKAVHFRLVPYDASGNLIPMRPDENRMFVRSIRGFKPGEIDRLEMAPILSRALKGVDVKTFNIEFSGGEWPAKYTFTMSRPSPNDNLRFEDAFVHASFAISPQQLTFTLRNMTDDPIFINWDKVSYVDFLGTSHRILHKGVRLVDREHPQPPTTIPPRAQIDELVFPVDYVEFVLNRWKQQDMLPGSVQDMKAPSTSAKMFKGKTISVFMPLEIGTAIKNYFFEFQATNVE